jgi:hypothetical protein
VCEIILALRVNGNHDVEQDDLVWVQFRFSLILHDEVEQDDLVWVQFRFSLILNDEVEQDDLVWVQFRFSLILHDEVGQERSSSYCIKVIRAIMN